MATVVVIPIKSFIGGKLRLAESVSPSDRSDLGRALANHVAENAESAGALPLIVTGSPDVAEWATGTGFPTLPEPEGGLDGAASAGADWARSSRSSWIVLHADLPLLTTGDIFQLAAAVESGHDVIAPSADGGTSAIGSSRMVEFAYGAGSFHRHLARLRAPQVVSTLGLLHDVDTPADLVSAAGHPRGAWMRGLIG